MLFFTFRLLHTLTGCSNLLHHRKQLPLSPFIGLAVFVRDMGDGFSHSHTIYLFAQTECKSQRQWELLSFAKLWIPMSSTEIITVSIM